MTATGRRRLPGSLLQRLAERQAPFARQVLLAIVADLQFEWQRAHSIRARPFVRVRGTGAFVRALGPVLVGAAGRGLEQIAWGRRPEDRAAGWKLLLYTLLATTGATGILLAYEARFPVVLLAPLPPQQTLLLLLPSVLCMTIPLGCLLGVLIAGRQAEPNSGQRWRPLLAVVAVATLLTFALAGWWTPRSNRIYRQRVFAALSPGTSAGLLSPGDRELTLGELELRRGELLAVGDTARARRMSLEWHKKPALAASCLAMALAALAATRARRIVLRALLGWAAIVAWGLLLRIGEQAADAGRIGPVVAMWGPIAALLVSSALIMFHDSLQRPTSQP